MLSEDAPNPDAAPFLRQTLVLIPALNEEACVAQTVGYWRGLGVAAVRVVDNGSTDNTALQAAAAGAEVLREARRGYGAACWTGLQHAPPVAEWILFSSADGSDQFSTGNLDAWQQQINAGAELILGDRVSAPEARRHLKWIQRFGNQLCCSLIFLGWRRWFNDMGSMRLVRVAALRQMTLQDRGFGWNIEMQVRAIELGLRVVELPVSYHPRRAGESKISGSVRGTIRAACGMMKIILRLWRTRRDRGGDAQGNAV